jgi:TRAP-type C4-dicarboxylate transport system permease small subunit
MLIILSLIVILGFFILYSAMIYDLFLNKIYPALRISSYMGLIDLSVLAANCITPLPFLLFGLNIWYAVYWWCLSVALAIIFAL